jgi:hypothetical protein
MAFVAERNSELETGVYGTDQVILNINENHSFRYQHKADAVDVSGTWEVDKKQLILHPEKSDSSIPTRWKLNKTYPCISGRYAAEFLRLCHKDS